MDATAPAACCDDPLESAHVLHPSNGLVTVEYAQFADDVAEMKVHRALGDVQLVADVGTHHTARREMEALELARGKRAAFLHGRNPLFNDRLHKYEGDD